MAVVVITHNVLHAFQVADRFVVLHQGRVAAVRRRQETGHDEVVALITTGTNGAVPAAASAEDPAGHAGGFTPRSQPATRNQGGCSC